MFDDLTGAGWRLSPRSLHRQDRKSSRGQEGAGSSAPSWRTPCGSSSGSTTSPWRSSSPPNVARRNIHETPGAVEPDW